MRQMLQRGLEIRAGYRIERLLAGDEEWAIYSTNRNAYVLAATSDLVSYWITEFDVPDGIFPSGEQDEIKVFCGADKYLIGSLNQGPYPQVAEQIEAFSIAYCTTRRLFPNFVFDGALYIEEYSLILPTQKKTAESMDSSMVYGKWLTSGINISVDSYDRFRELMSWMPEEYLQKCISLSGIQCSHMKSKRESRIAQDEHLRPESGIEQDKPTEFELLGRPELESFFKDNIIDIVHRADEYKRMGIDFPGATILFGPPGCGKTFAVDRLCEYLGWPRYDIDASSIASAYIHETSKKIAEVFKAAIAEAPSIIVIDEMEAFLSDRSRVTTGTHHAEEVAEFLRRIPEAISNKVLVFAMTNVIDMIDPAILRRGRFDHIVEVQMASKDEILQLLRGKIRDIPVDETVDVARIAAKLDRHPLSDVTFVLREAGRIAVKQGMLAINQECINGALAMLPEQKATNKIGFSV